MSRVGLLAGTFDPVHAGHIAFALQTINEVGLDKVYFLPERRPRHKSWVEHFGHRVAMLSSALAPHPKLEVIELIDMSFSVQSTLEHIREQLPTEELVFIVGSDVAQSMKSWPGFNKLCASAEIVIGMRYKDDEAVIQNEIRNWPGRPNLRIISAYAPDISSSAVREALRRSQAAAGILPSVKRYSSENWLYVSLA